MALTKSTKTAVIKKFEEHEGDTGSTSVQIAIITERINQLSEHLKENKKDLHSRRGLLGLVGKRRRLLNYLKKNDEPKYAALIKELKLRK